jgi:peptidylprolyl isomerase
MTQAISGDTVKVHYTGKLNDGTQFDTSAEGDPLQFTLGDGQIIPGFEEAVTGMSLGETRTNTIPADQAYGPHQEEMVLIVERDAFPADIDPALGQQLEVRQADGRTIDVIITEITESSVTLDANHPLAGQDLTFEIQLVEII